MRLAFLILAHQDFTHLERLVRRLLAADCDVYVHVDRKVRELPEIRHPRVVFIQDRVDVAWAGFSMVQATLNLLRQAHRQGGYAYYALLSGADYPIRPLPDLYRHLAASDADHIQVVPFGTPDKPLSRVLAPYFEAASRHSGRSLRGLLARLANRSCEELYRRTGLGRSPPLPIGDFYAGSQWFCLRDASVRHVLDFVAKRPDFVGYCRHALVPDEFFFQTVLMTAPARRMQPNLHFMIWNGGTGPAILTERQTPEILEACRRGAWFFGRKFSTRESAGLLSTLDAAASAVAVTDFG